MSNNPKDGDPAAELRQITLGTMMAQALYAAAKLGIADQLVGGPKDCNEMAASVGADRDALYRLLRALASRGIFREVERKRFELTPLGEMLRSDVPGSVQGWAIFRGEPFVWNSWGAILHSVRTGNSAFTHVHGVNAFDYFKQNREAGEVFNRAMGSLTAQTTSALLEAYDFSPVRTLVDVGGGNGALLAAILKEYDGMKGILADLPHVVANSVETLEASGVSRRCRAVAVDFFESIPTGGDAYLFKHILHDWSDEDVVRILTNCRKATLDSSRLLVVEAVIPEGNDPHPGKFVDLEMLVMAEGGRERTTTEFGELFDAAGFQLKQLFPTNAAFSILEATPVESS